MQQRQSIHHVLHLVHPLHPRTHVVHSVHHAAHVGVHLPVATAPVVCRWTHGLRTHALVAIAVPILGVVLGRRFSSSLCKFALWSSSHLTIPDGLLLLLAQALPGFQPTVANDVDPNQDNLVNSIFIVEFNVAVSSLLARVGPHLLINACASAVLIEISFQVIVSHIVGEARVTASFLAVAARATHIQLLAPAVHA